MLLAAEEFRWPPPGHPPPDSVVDDEWHDLVATFLIEARHVGLEAELVEGASEDDTAGYLNTSERPTD